MIIWSFLYVWNAELCKEPFQFQITLSSKRWGRIMIAKIQKEVVLAMKARNSERTQTLRLMVNALKNKEKEKRLPLTQQESEQVLYSMIKQRKDSIEQFTKGNRNDLVEIEAKEIAIIEDFLPKMLDDGDLNIIVLQAVADLKDTLGRSLTPKDMGSLMKASQSLVAQQLKNSRPKSKKVKKVLVTGSLPKTISKTIEKYLDTYNSVYAKFLDFDCLDEYVDNWDEVSKFVGTNAITLVENSFHEGARLAQLISDKDFGNEFNSLLAPLVRYHEFMAKEPLNYSANWSLYCSVRGLYTFRHGEHEFVDIPKSIVDAPNISKFVQGLIDNFVPWFRLSGKYHYAYINLTDPESYKEYVENEGAENVNKVLEICKDVVDPL